MAILLAADTDAQLSVYLPFSYSSYSYLTGHARLWRLLTYKEPPYRGSISDPFSSTKTKRLLSLSRVQLQFPASAGVGALPGGIDGRKKSAQSSLSKSRNSQSGCHVYVPRSESRLRFFCVQPESPNPLRLPASVEYRANEAAKRFSALLLQVCLSSSGILVTRTRSRDPLRQLWAFRYRYEML
ncbi:uncharacterized protein YALI1_B03324g [Yarrowia lipolytica]|uniref:Uncharacterized protein n=1 Tax=Yarrowia lipolytica TaxID=4952 RepID=A0A1D8N655_YARLL|nr:hypothetical protein YALI1_B03324g [Yarrowia lipolytica]